MNGSAKLRQPVLRHECTPRHGLAAPFCPASDIRAVSACVGKLTRDDVCKKPFSQGVHHNDRIARRRANGASEGVKHILCLGVMHDCFYHPQDMAKALFFLVHSVVHPAR